MKTLSESINWESETLKDMRQMVEEGLIECPKMVFVCKFCNKKFKVELDVIKKHAEIIQNCKCERDDNGIIKRGES